MFLILKYEFPVQFPDVNCGKPPRPKNSKKPILTGTSFNRSVSYKCNTHHKLRGSKKRICRAIGEWDGKKARCSTFYYFYNSESALCSYACLSVCEAIANSSPFANTLAAKPLHGSEAAAVRDVTYNS